MHRIIILALFGVCIFSSFPSNSQSGPGAVRWGSSFSYGSYVVNWSCALFHGYRHNLFKHVSYCEINSKDIKSGTVTTQWIGKTSNCVDGSEGPDFYSDFSPLTVTKTIPHSDGILRVPSELYQNTVQHMHFGGPLSPSGVRLWAEFDVVWKNGVKYNRNSGAFRYASKGCV